MEDGHELCVRFEFGTEKKILDLPIFTKERLSEILEYQVNIQMLEKQKQLICDAIASNIALGIEYEKLKISMKQYGDIHAKKCFGAILIRIAL